MMKRAVIYSQIFGYPSVRKAISLIRIPIISDCSSAQIGTLLFLVSE